MILYLVCFGLGIVAILVSLFTESAAVLIGMIPVAGGLYMLWFMEFGPWRLPVEPKPLAPLQIEPDPKKQT